MRFAASERPLRQGFRPLPSTSTAFSFLVMRVTSSILQAMDAAHGDRVRMAPYSKDGAG